jgi:hypothetical protein
MPRWCRTKGVAHAISRTKSSFRAQAVTHTWPPSRATDYRPLPSLANLETLPPNHIPSFPKRSRTHPAGHHHNSPPTRDSFVFPLLYKSGAVAYCKLSIATRRVVKPIFTACDAWSRGRRDGTTQRTHRSSHRVAPGGHFWALRSPAVSTGGRRQRLRRRCRRAGSAAVGSLTCSHLPRRRDSSWYSVTVGGGGGVTVDPGCLPGRVRVERFFTHGAAEEGGREEFLESAPRWRSSSAIR